MIPEKNNREGTPRSVIRRILWIFVSIIASIGIQSYLQSYLPNTNILYILLIPLYLRLFKLIRIPSKRLLAIGGLTCIFFAFLLVAGYQFDETGDLSWSFPTAFAVASLALGLFPPYALAIELIRKASASPNELFEAWSRKCAITVFAIAFLSDMVALLALFPGVYGYDAGFQILSVLDPGTAITSHFSVPYTLLLGGLVSAGINIFGSAECGLAACMILQSVLVSIMVTRITYCVLRITRRKIAAGVCLAFYAFDPFFVTATISSAQDVPFCAFFGLLCAELALVTMDSNPSLSKSTIFRISLIALAMCVFRNNGVYVIAVAVVVFLALSRKHIEQAPKLLACLIAPALLALLITGPLYSSLGIASGNSLREMMSIPVQQLARVYHLNEPTTDRKGIPVDTQGAENRTQSLSEERKERIERYFTDDLPNYSINPSISDLQKAALDTEEVANHPLAFLKLYLGTGIHYPAEYFEAFMMNSLGFWYPNKIYPDIRTYHPLLGNVQSLAHFDSSTV